MANYFNAFLNVFGYGDPQATVQGLHDAVTEAIDQLKSHANQLANGTAVHPEQIKILLATLNTKMQALYEWCKHSNQDIAQMATRYFEHTYGQAVTQFATYGLSFLAQLRKFNSGCVDHYMKIDENMEPVYEISYWQVYFWQNSLLHSPEAEASAIKQLFGQNTVEDYFDMNSHIVNDDGKTTEDFTILLAGIQNYNDELKKLQVSNKDLHVGNAMANYDPNDLPTYFPPQSTLKNSDHNGKLNAGQFLLSDDGHWQLILCEDGKLTSFNIKNSPGCPDVHWKSSANPPIGLEPFAELTEDGTFGVWHNNHNIWSAPQNGGEGSKVVLEDDGSLKLFAAEGEPVWVQRLQSGAE